MAKTAINHFGLSSYVKGAPSMNYKEQLEFVKGLRLAEGERRSITCPACGGHKKFTVERLATSGKILWNCFRASCPIRGGYNGPRSIKAAKAFLSADCNQEQISHYLPIPAITSRLEHSDKACEYVYSVNSFEAYKSGLIKVRYAPREDRVLFYSNDQKGAVGRSLNGGVKWMTYGDVSAGFAIGEGGTAVAVEDVPSACAVSMIPGYVGYALCGTTLKKCDINALNKYNKVVIILDNDAKSKAVRLQKKIRGNVTMRITSEDLKVLEVNKLTEILGSSQPTLDQVDGLEFS